MKHIAAQFSIINVLVFLDHFFSEVNVCTLCGFVTQLGFLCDK